MADPVRYEHTSERITADEPNANEAEYLIYLFHLATYQFARAFVRNKRVLDFGCGTGYGPYRLVPDCDSVVGVDVAAEAVRYAEDHYSAPNLTFQHIDPVERGPLPFPDRSFGAVLSFQVIEHVPDPHRYLDEISRVLQPDGVLILATPDRSTRLFRGQRPWNRYHLTEYDAEGLGRVVRAHFSKAEMARMGGDAEVLEAELRRCRRLRLATLPFTFPGAPERWRQAGLAALKTAQTRMRGSAAAREPADNPSGGAGASAAGQRHYAYDETALHVDADASPSVNLIAVCREPRR